MPAKSKQAVVNRTLKEDNALQRLLCLPVVNSACNSLQKTYTTTKKSHPLVASMCEAYERGIQAVSSLVMWSMKPVIQKLEPQFAAANVLACQGLDHLEQRIPALHKPVEEVTSELKDSICTHVQSTVHSIADALDWILGLAAESCEQAQNTMRDVTKDARSSKVSHLAEAGVETALGKVEKLVDLLLPKPEHSSAHDNSGARVLREGSPSSIFGRIRAVACSVSQYAYRQTTQTIQYTSNKGQEWAMRIPGLGGLARQSSTKAQWVFFNEQNIANGWLSKGQRKAPEKREERKNEDDRTSTTEESAKAQSLPGSLTQNLQAASLSTISGMKEAHFTACNAAGQLLSPHRAVSERSTKVGMLWGILQNVTGSFLGTIVHYVPVPRLFVKAEGTATVMAEGSETYQRQKSSQPVVTHTQEKGAHYQLRGDWRSNRGHHPLTFLNLDEPHLVQQAPVQRRSSAFEADYTSAHKSAFSPYKEAASSRRLSEGLYRSSPERVYSKAHYTGLYGTILKKD
ncbi:PREDICTED: perilipin-1 [Gekko japonicus]|uniref:Perilipin-1 n=1 Tax=Gekko japonicus TaxID=146911 RepID=A0ABM1KM10_GEKJA|nr:PREDICTED: perilipin-1 [Gekko japonicus]XP_015274747.1 PREDICTED: perilipin-1 [Gekko japonicus]